MTRGPMGVQYMENAKLLNALKVQGRSPLNGVLTAEGVVLPLD